MDAADRALLSDILSEYGASETPSPPPSSDTPPVSSPSSPPHPPLHAFAVNYLIPPPLASPQSCTLLSIPRTTTLPITFPKPHTHCDYFTFRITALVGTVERLLGSNSIDVAVKFRNEAGDSLGYEPLSLVKRTTHVPMFRAARRKKDEGGGELVLSTAEEGAGTVNSGERCGQVVTSFKVDDGDDGGDDDDEVRPIQLAVKLPQAAGEVLVEVSNGNVFRPRRCIIQHAFVESEVVDAANVAAEDTLSSTGGADKVAKSNRMRPVPFDLSDRHQVGTAGTILSSILIGGGVVATGGVGIIAGGVLTMALGGGGMVIKDKIVERIKRKETQEEEDTIIEVSREEILEQKMVELSRLTTTTLEEARAKHLSQIKVWEEREALQKELVEKAKGEAKVLLDEKKAAYRERMEVILKEGKGREDELIASLVEMESAIRKLKREKKVLVTEIKTSRKAWEDKEVKLRGEATTMRINWNSLRAEKAGEKVGDTASTEEDDMLAQLRARHVKLIGLLRAEPGNEELKTLVENIRRSIEQVENSKKSLNFVH